MDFGVGQVSMCANVIDEDLLTKETFLWQFSLSSKVIFCQSHHEKYITYKTHYGIR